LTDTPNYFAGMSVIHVLQMTYYWAAICNEGDLHKRAEAMDLLDYWMDVVGDADGIETTIMGLGDDAFFQGRHGQDDDGTFTDDPDNAYMHAHVDDLAVDDTYTMGYYFGRNNTAWSGVNYQVKFTAGTKRQHGGANEYVFYASATQTPIILDMDGNGKLEASNGEWLPHEKFHKERMVSFDINGDGFDEITEWAGPNDGILLVYDGGEVSGKNLFGNEGGKYRNGYEKLSLLDANEDKKISGEELKTLSVWQDKNSDGKVDNGEITAVTDLDITEISVAHKHCVASFIQNGVRKLTWDWHPKSYMVKKK
jgi:hypothetical protein